MALHWLDQGKCGYQGLWLVDSELLRNRGLRVAANPLTASLNDIRRTTTMNSYISDIEFYKELEFFLPTSDVEKRKMWASTIVENDIDIKELSKLLDCEHRIALRFLWLLTEIGQLNPNKLFIELPYLFDLCYYLNPIYKQSFATFWLVADVPPENEGKAVDLLFEILLSNDTKVTIKSRAILVLFKLTKKYPELKNELGLCLTEQISKHSNDFKKRALKILIEIEQ